jgi:acetyltransferase-like isoleucine patch superfamily enzyme
VDIRDQSGLAWAVAQAGSECRVVIGKNCTALPELYISLGARCRLVIGDDCSLAALRIEARDGALIEIGNGVSFVYRTLLSLAEPSHLCIGAGSLFADETIILTSDYHSVVDKQSGERINRAADVEIGQQVWLGTRAAVLKGVRIGRQAVIGFGAVVTDDVPPNCVAAGNPARVVKSGIGWHNILLP